MNLVIPPLGAELKLLRPWVFTLFLERRTSTFIESLCTKGIIDKAECLATGQAHDRFRRNALTSIRSYYGPAVPVAQLTLPTGSELRLDRIYIRAGAEDFNSLSFRLLKTPAQAVWKNARFWAKLGETLSMDVEILRTPHPPQTAPIAPQQGEIP